MRGGTKNLSQNNSIPDDGSCGEAEERIIGAMGFFIADEEFSIAVEPAMAGFHDVASGTIPGFMDLSIAFVMPI